MTGDCFTQTETDDQTTRTVVPCDDPHHGEVIALGPTACPIEISEGDFEGLMSAYVGVSPSELPEWMSKEGIGVISQVQFDDVGLLAGTLCALVAEDGELNHSYRVVLPGTRSQPPVIE